MKKTKIIGLMLVGALLSPVSVLANAPLDFIQDGKYSNIDESDFISRARDLYMEEMASLSSAEEVENFAFNYQFEDTDNNVVYLYENEAGEERASYYTYEDNEKGNSLATASKEVDLPDGIGGRQYIKAEGIRSITGYITLPTYANTYVLNYSSIGAFIYTGFSGGSAEADMGLLYSSHNGKAATEWNPGWKPVLLFEKTHFQPLPGYDQVQRINSYMPGEVIKFKAYPNYQNHVRLELYGKTRYSDPEGNGSQKYLKAILETNAPISRTKKAKLLATIASDPGSNTTASGRFTAVFSHLEINGKSVNSRDYYPAETDKAKVTTNGDKVTIQVNG